MSQGHSQYGDDANPADVEEQSTPVADDVDELDEGPTPHDDVDDADLLEQTTPVSDEDDYPNELEVEPDV